MRERDEPGEVPQDHEPVEERRRDDFADIEIDVMRLLDDLAGGPAGGTP